MLRPVWICVAAGAVLSPGLLLAQNAPATCNRTIYANVIALDQPLMMNRLGAAIPGGMIYALARDVVDRNSPAASPTTCDKGTCKPGEVGLRTGKRPRPIVVRVSVGDCLVVNLQNLVTASPSHDQLNVAQADV